MAGEKSEGKDKKITVDQEICIGCGTCVGIAPEYFKLNNEGKSSAIKQYTVEDDKKIIEAVDSCPVDAISLK